MDEDRAAAEDEGAEGVVRTFLIADVRGYTRFTQTYGDEAAAELAGRFARLTRDVVTAGGGELIELRGDEALAVFTSPRQAVRTAVEVQRRLRGGDDPEDALPLGIGIGLDTGEAVPVEGGYRGKALNVAARLCSLAAPGQILATETVCSLAGSVPEVHLRPRKPVRVKGIEQPVRQWEVVPDSPLPPLRPLEGAKPASRRRRVAVLAGVGVAVIVAAVAAALVLGGEGSAGRLATNSLGSVDRSGNVHDVVAVGKAPADVVSVAGTLWVADETGHSLLEIDPHTHDVTSFSLDEAQPTALAYGDRALWVLDAASRHLLRWSPEAGRLVASYAVGNGASDVAYGGGAAWVANEIDGTVTRVAASNGKTETVGVGVGPASAAFGSGALWVANAGGDSVARVDARNTSDVEQIPVGNDPRSVAIHGGRVWVTSAADGTVWEIDTATRSARQTVPLVDPPSALAADDSGVWVASERAGTLTRVEGSDATAHEVGGGPTALSVVGDRVWVTARAPDASHRGGTLRLAGRFPVTDQQFGSPGANVNPVLGDGLVVLKAAGGASGVALVADLATAIPRPTDDGRTYTFEVRRGIRYSDGRPVKPNDFVQTFRRLFRIQDPGTVSFFYGGLTGARACLDHPKTCDFERMVTADDKAMTVTFHLERADPDFAYKLAFPLAWVLPPDTPMRKLETELVPSTGPYKIAEVVAGKRMVLTRNPYFREWSHDAQPDGYPDRIVITPAPNALDQVRRNRADVMVEEVPPGQLPYLATHFPAQVHGLTFNRLLYVFLNTKTPPFDDVRVRRAVALALDRGAVVNRIGGPLLNQVACQVIPPNLLGFRPYCPWTRAPGTGVWTGADFERAQQFVRASGTRGALVTVWRPVDDPWKSVALELAKTLRRLGYRVDVRVVPGDVFTYFGQVGDPKTKAQAGPGSWAPDLPLPGQMINVLLSCNSELSLSRYCNEDVDALAEEAAGLQATSPNAAADKWAEADRAMVDAAPIVPVAIQGYAQFVSKRVGNFQSHPVWGPMFGQMWVR